MITIRITADRISEMEWLRIARTAAITFAAGIPIAVFAVLIGLAA